MTEPMHTVFTTTVAGSGGKTGIVVPEEAVAQLGAGRRPAVHVELDGYAYRSTVAVMGGQSLIPVSAAVRQATGLEAGDPVEVRLSVATTPREVEVPQDLREALAADERAGGLLRRAVEQPAALPRRQRHLREDRGDEGPSGREGAGAVPRGQEALRRRWALPWQGNAQVFAGGAEGTRTPAPHRQRDLGRSEQVRRGASPQVRGRLRATSTPLHSPVRPQLATMLAPRTQVPTALPLTVEHSDGDPWAQWLCVTDIASSTQTGGLRDRHPLFSGADGRQRHLPSPGAVDALARARLAGGPLTRHRCSTTDNRFQPPTGLQADAMRDLAVPVADSHDTHAFRGTSTYNRGHRFLCPHSDRTVSIDDLLPPQHHATTAFAASAGTPSSTPRTIETDLDEGDRCSQDGMQGVGWRGCSARVWC